MVDSHCPYCALQCAMSLELEGERVEVTARDFPTNRGGMCRKGWTSAEVLRAPDRLTTPLVRGADGELHPTGWDEVLDLLAGRLAARTDEPFAGFEPHDLRTIGTWLEHAETRWPQRRSRRAEYHPHGRRIDLRATLRSSRRTGWDPVRLMRTRPCRRPRRIVVLCDVSGSMQPYTTIYLHLMRAAALRGTAGRPEVFAFATSLTRLTSVLDHRSAETALARANERVVDRFGGTRIGRCLGDLLVSHWGSSLRGAVVVIASDGWDSDDPELLRRSMIRLRRRAWKIVWLNPRLAAVDYRPAAGGMAVALDYVDLFLPAHTIAEIHVLLAAVTALAS